MKKKLAGALLVVSLLVSMPIAFAKKETCSTDINGKEVCSNELVNELVKQTIYAVGTTVLNKMVNPNTTYITPTPVYTTPATTTTTTTNTANTNTDNNTNTTTNTTQNEIKEDLIPIN